MQNSFAQLNVGQQWNPSVMRKIEFAPDNLEVEKFPIILQAKDKIARLYVEHAHNICVQQGTEPVKAFAAKIPHHWTQKNTVK